MRVVGGAAIRKLVSRTTVAEGKKWEDNGAIRKTRFELVVVRGMIVGGLVEHGNGRAEESLDSISG